MTPPAPGPTGPGHPTVPGARAALVLLVAINLFNYIDRQILSAVLPLLELDGTLFSPTDPNLKFKLGLLPSAFLAAYMLFSPLVGWLDGHGYRRWVVLGLGVSVWSLASGGSGFATGYWMLFATRCLVGIGEGAYGPVASALISDAFSTKARGKALAAFNLAIPVGSALGYVIGGAVAEAAGWRHAFWVTFSGLLLGLWCFLKRELQRPVAPAALEHAPSYGTVLKRLLKNRSFYYCCAGMTAVTFVLGGVSAWVPAYVFQRESRFVLNAETLDLMGHPPEGVKRRVVPPEALAKLQPLADGTVRNYVTLKAQAKAALSEQEMQLYFEPLAVTSTTPDSIKLGTIGIVFGGVVVVGGLVAVLFATWLGENLKPRLPGAYFWVIGGGALVAFPAFVAFLYLPLPWGWLCVFGAVVGLFMHVGPGNTILANVVTSEMRATAFAINILVIHALGDVISQPLIGFVADQAGWQTALLATSGMILVSGGLWCYGARFLEADTARAAE